MFSMRFASPQAGLRPFRTALLALVAFSLLAAAPATAEMTLDEILSNYYEALGGKDAWAKVENVRQTGSMSMMGMEAPFTVVLAEPNKTKVEFEIQGMKGIQSFDGDSGWQLMPFMGSTEPEEMPDEMVKMMSASAGVAGPLFDYEAKGNKVELVGTADVEGTAAYQLHITLPNGFEMDWFLDAEYFVPIQSKMTMEVQGQTFETTTTLSDYKEIGGVMMAHSTTQSTPMGAQTMTVTKTEVNVDLGDDFFAMPAKAESEEGGE